MISKFINECFSDIGLVFTFPFLQRFLFHVKTYPSRVILTARTRQVSLCRIRIIYGYAELLKFTLVLTT